jgi:hypothetical protein
MVTCSVCEWPSCCCQSRTHTRALSVRAMPAWPVWPQGSGTELRASCACSGVQVCAPLHERAHSRPHVLHTPRCTCGSLLASSTTVRDGLQGLLWKHARRGNTQGVPHQRVVVCVLEGARVVLLTAPHQTSIRTPIWKSRLYGLIPVRA